MPEIKILAISGNLRAASLNTAAVHALAALAPAGVRVEVFPNLAFLPLFNPDFDREPLSQHVQNLRQAVDNEDVLIICSPEYAHGMTGALKNALDWLVGSPNFAGKPVVVLNMSHRATHADAQTREVLRMMSANLLESASQTIALKPQHLDTKSMLEDTELCEKLAAVLTLAAQSAGQQTATLSPIV